MLEKEKIIFTGGRGLLGAEFKKLKPNYIYPSSKEFDITNLKQMDNYLRICECNTLIHAAAFTSPPKIDVDPIKGINVNIIGTSNIVKLCSEYNIDKLVKSHRLF